MRKYVIVRNTVTSNYTSPKKKTHTGDKGFGERHMVSCGSFVELNPLFCISKRAQTPFSKHITHTHANYFLPNERQHTSNEKTVFLLLKIFCIASTFLLHPTLHVTTISHTWMLFVRSGTSRLYQHIYIITYGCETIWHSFIIVSLLWLSYIHSSKEKKKKIWLSCDEQPRLSFSIYMYLCVQHGAFYIYGLAGFDELLCFGSLRQCVNVSHFGGLNWPDKNKYIYAYIRTIRMCASNEQTTILKKKQQSKRRT